MNTTDIQSNFERLYYTDPSSDHENNRAIHHLKVCLSMGFSSGQSHGKRRNRWITCLDYNVKTPAAKYRVDTYMCWAQRLLSS